MVKRTLVARVASISALSTARRSSSLNGASMNTAPDSCTPETRPLLVRAYPCGRSASTTAGHLELATCPASDQLLGGFDSRMTAMRCDVVVTAADHLVGGTPQHRLVSPLLAQLEVDRLLAGQRLTEIRQSGDRRVDHQRDADKDQHCLENAHGSKVDDAV